ncbi:MAG: hypothetical protein PHD12_04260 [Methylotenera sp.]|nr:hypothetical protein [Methylotenera sp.]
MANKMLNRKISWVFSSVLIVFSTFSIAKDNPVKNAWFEHTSCNLLKINKFNSISDHRVMRSVTIHDHNTIKNFIARISAIPANGDMMISFGPKAEVSNLEFHCENKIQTIAIYGKRFKTPSTGFNSGKNETEEQLYQDIDGLLFPDFNKIILKVKDLALPFKDFSITYKGEEFKDFSPKTITYKVDNFLITDRSSKEQSVQIISGQIPPPPHQIEINRKKTTLLTYETKNNFRLFPQHFQIVR